MFKQTLWKLLWFCLRIFIFEKLNTVDIRYFEYPLFQTFSLVHSEFSLTSLINPFGISNSLSRTFTMSNNFLGSFSHFWAVSHSLYRTDDKLSSFNISSEVIFQLIKNLDPNKAHGHDEIFVKMLKLCTPSICKSLALLFENCLASGEFPNVWKKK